jgi:tRNA 2-thiouridine synthesizing protein A
MVQNIHEKLKKVQTLPMKDEETPHLLDCRGLQCPLPVLKTRKKLLSIPVGQRLLVMTTDPVAVVDIPDLVNQMQVTLIEQTTHESDMHFLIMR